MINVDVIDDDDIVDDDKDDNSSICSAIVWNIEVYCINCRISLLFLSQLRLISPLKRSSISHPLDMRSPF